MLMSLLRVVREAAVHDAGMGGFNALHALSTRNDDPQSLQDLLMQP